VEKAFNGKADSLGKMEKFLVIFRIFPWGDASIIEGGLNVFL